MSRVFLSYGHDEFSGLAQRLKTGLEAAGLPTWFDVERLKPGGDWERYIAEGLEWAAELPGEGRFVLLMTPHSVRRPDGYCLNELARAIARELPIVPVMVDTVEPPLSIARLQWLDMCGILEAGDGVFEDKLERLRHAVVEQDLDFEGVQSRLVHRLQPLSFEAEIDEHLPHFTGRRWVADILSSWLDDPDGDRVLWITGGPGAGKTALSAWLTTQRPELAAVHFCQSTNARKVDPRQAAMSIAHQLSTQLLTYEQRLNALPLETILEGTDVQTLFDDLVVEPLAGLEPDDGGVRLILVDALDEATRGGQNELTRFLTGALAKLPEWLRLVLTSRPAEPEVAVHLQGFEPLRLEEAPENAEDLKAYIAQSLSRRGEPDGLAEAEQTIFDRSDGSFLYARWVALEVEAGRLSVDDPDEFPRGLGAIYLRFFERQFSDPAGYKERQRPVLEAMLAAKTPLPLEELATMLGWSEYDAFEIPESFGSLVSVREGALHPFHLSVLEWVSDRAKAGRYWAAPGAGRRRLADYGWAQYEARPEAMPTYALHHTSAHLTDVGRADDSVRLLLDYRILSRRNDDGGVAIADDLRDAAAAVTDPEQTRALELLGSVFGLAAGIFVRDPEQLASQLQARLLSHDQPLLRELVDQALARAEVPLLRALTPALRQAGDPLTRVFRGVLSGDEDPELFALSAVSLDTERDLALATGEASVVFAWRLSTGRVEQRVVLEGSGYWCGAIDRVGGHLALGGWDGRVTVLSLDDLASGLVNDEVGGIVADIDVSPDGTRLCTAHSGSPGAVKLWLIEMVELEQRLEVADTAEAVAFAPDGLSLAVGIGKEVRVGPAVDLNALKKRASFPANVEALAFSPDGATLAVGLDDGTIRVLPARGRSRPRMIGGHPIFGHVTKITGLRFAQGGGRLLSAGWDSALRVWDTDAGVEVAACHTDSKLFGLAVDETGRWALTGLKMGGPRLWDISRMTDAPSIDRHGRFVSHTLCVEGRNMAVTGGPETDGASIRVWRSSDGTLAGMTRVTGDLLSLALDADGRTLNVLDEAGISSCLLADFAAGGDVELELGTATPLDPAPASYWPICMAADVVAAVRSGYPDDKVIVWRAPDWVGKSVRTLKPANLGPIAISANSRICAVRTGDGALQAFDLRRRRTQNIELDPDFREDFSALAVSPSGALVGVASGQGAVTLVDLGSGEARAMRTPNGDWIGTIAFSGDETSVLVATSGGRLELWDVASGTQEALFCGSESWSTAWVSERAEQIIAGDALGAVHFLVRQPTPVEAAARA